MAGTAADDERGALRRRRTWPRSPALSLPKGQSVVLCAVCGHGLASAATRAPLVADPLRWRVFDLTRSQPARLTWRARASAGLRHGYSALYTEGIKA